jgi:WD40 repeat protein
MPTLPKIASLIFLIGGCGPLSNQFDQAKLQCGAFPSSAKRFVTVAAEDSQLDADEFQAVWVTKDGSQPVEKTSKGCIIVPDDAPGQLAIRSHLSDASGLFDGQEFNDPINGLNLLEAPTPLSSLAPSLTCEVVGTIKDQLNLHFSEVDTSTPDLFTINSEISGNSIEPTNHASLYDPTNPSALFQLGDNYPSGSYELTTNISSVFGTQSAIASQTCGFTIDKETPSIHHGFDALEKIPYEYAPEKFLQVTRPGMAIEIAGQDTSPTSVSICLREFPEGVQTDETCEKWSEIDGVFYAPAGGIWKLHFRVVDAVGNLTESSRSFAVIDDSNLNHIRSMADSVVKLAESNRGYDANLKAEEVKTHYNQLALNLEKRSILSTVNYALNKAAMVNHTEWEFKLPDGTLPERIFWIDDDHFVVKQDHQLNIFKIHDSTPIHRIGDPANRVIEVLGVESGLIFYRDAAQLKRFDLANRSETKIHEFGPSAQTSFKILRNQNHLVVQEGHQLFTLDLSGSMISTATLGADLEGFQLEAISNDSKTGLIVKRSQTATTGETRLATIKLKTGVLIAQSVKNNDTCGYLNAAFIDSNTLVVGSGIVGLQDSELTTWVQGSTPTNQPPIGCGLEVWGLAADQISDLEYGHYANNKLIQKDIPHVISGIKISPDKKIFVSNSQAKTLKAWSDRTAIGSASSITMEGQSVETFALHKNEFLIASTSEDQIIILDQNELVANGDNGKRYSKKFKPTLESISNIALSPNGSFGALLGESATIQIIRTRSSGSYSKPMAPFNPMLAKANQLVAISSDGPKTLVAYTDRGSPKALRVVDEEGRTLHSLVHQENIQGATFSKGGSIITWGDSRLYFWRADQLVNELEVDHPIRSVLTTDQVVVVTTTKDVKSYRLRQGAPELIAEFAVESLDYGTQIAPKGASVAIQTSDRIHWLRLPALELIKSAKSDLKPSKHYGFNPFSQDGRSLICFSRAEKRWFKYELDGSVQTGTFPMKGPHEILPEALYILGEHEFLAVQGLTNNTLTNNLHKIGFEGALRKTNLPRRISQIRILDNNNIAIKDVGARRIRIFDHLEALHADIGAKPLNVDQIMSNQSRTIVTIESYLFERRLFVRPLAL